MKKIFLFILFGFSLMSVFSQQDSTVVPVEEEEDFSMYDNLGFADGDAKRYCTSKVFDLSPAKLISFGFDLEGPATLVTDSFPGVGNNGGFGPSESRYRGVGGVRFGANIPVISRNDIIIQVGATYWQHQFYEEENPKLALAENPVNQTIRSNGLRTTGLNTTIFKPFNEKHFALFQASGDLNGDYNFSNMGNLDRTRISAAAIFGWKKHDRRMVGVGISRTYRVGELNYIPIVLVNWTAPNRKWGVEALAPARVHVRRTFSSRSLLLLGYELEGNSYFLAGNNALSDDRFIELRRSELRIRAVYERSLKNFIWISLQAGLRYNYAFEVDEFQDGNEFFRGFFGDQPYLMENTLGNTFYTMISINLVSP
ncbi:MAG: DUF6268 family outer membrane beta-barrel protein [Flavobacteriales bacterium]|jgi:hypothetical protein